MWSRADLDDGYDAYKTGSSSAGSSGWVGSNESTWHSKQSGPGNNIFGRRLSAVSDSGDTGIGTYCSESVEDDSCSSTTPSLQPLSRRHSSQEDGLGSSLPIVHVTVSPTTSSYTSLKMIASPSSTGHRSKSWQLTPPVTSPLSAPTSVNMKDQQPIRRWSSLTKLSSGVEKNSKNIVHQQRTDSHGSLDRGLYYGDRKEPGELNRDLFLPVSPSWVCHSLLQCSPGAGSSYWNKYNSRSGLETDLSLSSTLSSPIKHSSLDINYCSLAEANLAKRGDQVYGLSLSKLADSPLGHPVDRDSPIQPAVRTQMWLTEQMEYSSKAEHGAEPGQIVDTETKVCGGEGPPFQQGINQMLQGTSHFVNTLVKVKEGMLRQRELEIDRQKQQILQLHARIRENELRAQQVLHSQRWFDDPQILKMKDSVKEVPSDRLCCDEELSRKLAVSELEVLHLNELYKQATQKYTEDLKKLEEKIKTRDRYISSLKKKCQRESEQNHEKQQRIETLEKYLADLPTLGEVQVQALQLEEVQLRAQELEKTVFQLQKNLEDSSALLKEKDVKIEKQDRREKELIASVHGMQQKVQRCFQDGIRLDLKHLEVEKIHLLEKQDHSSKLIEHQKVQIETLNLQLKVTSTRLQKGRRQICLPDNQEGPSVESSPLSQQAGVDHWLQEYSPSNVEMAQVGQLFKELSLCLFDLQALHSILSQRAQGKELNLSLLLGLTSLNVPAEESELRDTVEQVGALKRLEVCQLRKGIDELRKSMSDCYTHYIVDNLPGMESQSDRPGGTLTSVTVLESQRS
ncbi:centrosomal protein of 85 kDa-like isoform X2 [Syngnathoides biaculeatus]|uniref:centrosomal protein of 85 kDa-like isoform X2 n=1 Tax=Syngnathoides biaculeatus TaxID=300417 RepID=UPI002ADDA0BA|nr:centrosomal protein of 85 kDa-like isoform X2 [Syngnathoides biaculeatus]